MENTDFSIPSPNPLNGAGGVSNEEQPSASMVLRSAAQGTNLAFQQLPPSERTVGQPCNNLRQHLEGRRAHSGRQSGPQISARNGQPSRSQDLTGAQKFQLQTSHLKGQAQLLNRLMTINSQLLHLGEAPLQLAEAATAVPNGGNQRAPTNLPLQLPVEQEVTILRHKAEADLSTQARNLGSASTTDLETLTLTNSELRVRG